MKMLVEWKNSAGRQPLIIQGARQVGKTWLMKEFGKRHFRHVAYFVFEKNERLRQIFTRDLDPKRILSELGYLANALITPETLIVFDEVQECPVAVTALKYFAEECPEYPIIAAGSYLGLATHRGLSFPVGKVDFLTLRPLDFFEFLDAMGEKMKLEALRDGRMDALRVVHDELMDWVKRYIFVGGMPKAVLRFLESRDLAQVRRAQKKILDSYESDFSKHIPSSELGRVRMLWHSIPVQLSKENKKFFYNVLKKGARAKDFEIALSWLGACGLVHQVHRINKAGLPLSTYVDLSAFKLFLSDVGLMSAMAGLTGETLLGNVAIFEEFKGALVEQYVLQELVADERVEKVYYWSNEMSTAEVDFLLQGEDAVVPVEVKSGINLKAKSLKCFIEKHQLRKALRFSSANYKRNDVIIDVPLYGVAWTHMFLKTNI